MLHITMCLVISVVPICAVLVGIVLGVGHSTLPDTQLEEQFGLNACVLPCWAGLVPGETLPDDAPQIIADHLTLVENRFLVSPTGINFWLRTENGMSFSGVLQFSRGVIQTIQFNAPIPVGYFVAQLGTPDCIFISKTDQPKLYGLYWESELTSVAAYLTTDERMRPETLIANIVLSDDHGFCDDELALDWRGFAPSWRY